MDFKFILNNINVYVDAAFLTIKISFFGILFSIIIGLILSLILYYKIPILKNISKIYIEISRNTPLLIQLYFLYYGLPSMFNFKFSAENSAIIALSFLGASYMCESFRGAINQIDKIQIESALSLGLKQFQIIRYIILPLGFSYSIPSLSANIIFLIKETSVVTAIALADLMFATNNIIANYYKTNEALFLLVSAYLIILLPLSLTFSYLEKRFRYV
ncbi:amino acid ABC transporter permease [Helicobacter sp. MIT 14-3879]|uniref:amino acid ABC transporter permease n=1 Tax=Helicobacter sp. MIT 14-3879 TaxID=2040649 RepID=UPI000E1F34A4|nr:amino acid ABC transporter permease [Helicobacter sp. MIT 14-3879]RDU63991.1 polar amino acid ABC transporter permease [Helicobacter sp. MIT 14-3879]